MPYAPPQFGPASAVAIALEVERLLGEAGVRAALALLNARVRFRFTGLFRVESRVLRNISLVDRENPGMQLAGAVTSLDIGYCATTCATNRTFTTSDARLDRRLASHPARDSMIAYLGTPLRARDRTAWGTLCHFDTRPRVISPDECRVLETVAPLFASHLCGPDGVSPAGSQDEARLLGAPAVVRE